MFCVILKCVFAIYLLQEAPQVLARRKPHRTKYKIDEFIEKLLASKKFDILAERFAQKAVERMVNLKPELRFTKDFAAEVVSQKIPFNNVSYKTDVHLEETHSHLQNLSLNFKHFTKGVLYDTHSNEQDGEKPETSTAISTTTTNDDSDRSINISDLESSLQDKSENTTENLEHNVPKETEKHLKKNTTVKQEETDGSISMENKKNGFVSGNELSENHQKNESYVEALSDFDKSVKKDRTLFSDVSKEESDLKNAETLRPRKRIHKEGNKLYTFQSSSDYDEYHQELERVEKERKIFV